MMAQGRLLHIQNHLVMICDSLWTINSMIIIPEMGVLYRYDLKWNRNLDWVLDLPTEFEDWEIDVAVAITDVEELLSRILDWEASLHHSIRGNIQLVHFRHVILVELKEMLCNLNSLVLRGSAMGLRRDPMYSMNPLQENYSNVLKNEVVGREEDAEKLIVIFQQQLISSNNDGDDNNPFVIAIVGKEGVGKTTLARMIYHHTWVRQQFYHRIWVDLPPSPSFTIITIIGKEFARSMSNEEHCDQKLNLDLPLQALWEYVNEQLDGSRYFLVLHCEAFDTTLKQQEWDELKNILLHVGGPGSAVLITSKSTITSDFPNWVEDIRTYYLNPLSEDAWVELFKRHAATPIPPMTLDKSENDELIPFAKQLFQSLIDQAFFARVFGSLSHIMQSTLPGSVPAMPEYIYMHTKFPHIHVRLNQYYHLLDANTDTDYEVLLHILIADYLVPAEGLASDLFDHPHKFLKEAMRITWRFPEYLLPRMLYLSMKVPKDSTSISSCCRYLCLKINPRARQFRPPTMSVEVSNKLITLILREDEEMTQEDDEKITLRVYKKRHMKAATTISKFLNKMLVRLVRLRILHVETSMIPRLPSEVSKLVNLRYLHLSKNKMELLPESLFDLPNLRILSLLHCKKLQRLPERIHKLKKLQILKLAHCTKLQQLPKSIIRLKNLVELNVEGCCFLSKLPEDLVSFKSLRIINITGCASLSRIPHKIEQSIGLRKLLGIFVGADGGLEFTQLQALINLQEIGLRNLEGAEEIQTEVLMGQQRLRNLSLHWGSEEANESSESATPLQVLEALQPNVHLERLEILSYKGVEFPNWMSKQQLTHLDSLVEVRLINLKRCVKLPSLGQLPNLQKLEISGMDLITHIDDTCSGDDNIFPMLTELTLSEMPALEKWSVAERRKAEFFPFFRELTLIQCPKLEDINPWFPDYFNLTMRIWLNNETIWSVECFCWNNLQCITRIEIVGCQELRCLPQGMRKLKLLSEMTINSCNNLTTLVALDSLEVLNIYACPLLAFKPEAFTRLSKLRMESCPKMQMGKKTR